ncbi:MAG: cyclic pyranopterin monophosphate synthase MoaC [Thermoproteus sp.]
MMVDISAKSDVERYAEGFAVADVKNIEACSAYGPRSVKAAYRYIPLLHPVPLSASATCRNDLVEVKAWTTWKTGVEMDALFGALVGSIAAGAMNIKKLGVAVKAKGVGLKLEEAVPPPAEVDRPDLGYIIRASGYIHLTSTGPIRSGALEKGDPICAAKMTAPLNAKRLCEILPVDCVKLEYANSKVEVGSDYVFMEVVLKGRDASPSLEALFATGTALLAIWDIMKKYEKDEKGQYPNTYIELGL